MTDPIHTFDSLKSAYLRYFDSPFDLRFEELVQARRRLLDRDGVLYREPLIEPQPALRRSGHDVRAATAACWRTSRRLDRSSISTTSRALPRRGSFFRGAVRRSNFTPPGGDAARKRRTASRTPSS